MRGKRGRPGARGLVAEEASPAAARGSRGGRGRGRGRGRGLWTLDCEVDENYQPSKRGRRRGSSLPRARGGRGSRGKRGGGRGGGGRGGRSKTLSKIIYDDRESSNEEEKDAVSLQSEDDFFRASENDADYEEDEEEPYVDDGSDYVEELPDEDDASYSSLRSRSSTCGDTPG